MAKAKKEKRKKTWWQRLLIFLAVAAAVWLIGHLVMQYVSGVVCENLTSIAESSAYVEKGNDQVAFDPGFDTVEHQLTAAAALSTYAYDPEDKSQDRNAQLQALGYENIQHFVNKPSQLYKVLAGKNKGAATMLSPVGATLCTRTLADGSTLIAVAFKGTDASNMNDDLSDLYKAVDKNGFHKGFLFNARQFQKESRHIAFTLGGKTVTFPEILTAMQQPNSPYKLLVTGHSLGAAVADVYAGYLLQDAGLYSKNMVTVTFGTPKSCATDFATRQSNILNIINTDDLVPTIGAQDHLGTCLYFTPTTDFRKQQYGDHYVEPNAYNSYSDLLTTAASGMIAHNMAGPYTAVAETVGAHPADYFLTESK